jgi:RNA 3'-terminal phosphate cyclase (ATP)
MADAILLDGGEGDGAALLPAALGLSLATGRSFEVFHFAAGAEPGLGASHVAAIRAAQEIGDAEVEGAEPGSARVRFLPRRPPASGELAVDLGADPAGPLLQALLVPLALAGAASRLVVRGGTHLAGSPSFHDLALGWVPLLARLGLEVDLRLGSAGFAPQGHGAVHARIAPAGPARSLDLRRRGPLRDARILTLAAGMAAEIPVRMAGAAARGLRLSGIVAEEESVPLPSGGGAGAAVVLEVAYENVTATVTEVREAGEDDGAAAEPAEAAGRRAADALVWHHAGGMAVTPRLAVDVLVPLAIGSAGLQGGPTPIHRFTCSEITPALHRVAQLVRRFLPVEVAVFGRDGEPGDVRVAPAGTGEILRLHTP